jgi:heme exporter protein D
VIISLVLLMVVSLYLYKRLLRREMHSQLERQVRDELSNYYKMDSSLREV